MRALTVLPGTVNSLQLDDIPDPPPRDGRVLVRALALGICGTDREIVSGEYGTAPPGEKRLVLGHESLGRVEKAPPNSGLTEGDLVVGIVRQPDPVPCVNCAAGEWDMCRNGRYTEHGIKERNGFGAERFRIAPEFAVKVDSALGILGVLLEPTSVVAKAWDHCDRVWRLKSAPARKLLVTGAGPIGLLGALLGAQRGYEVHVYDHNAGGPKPGVFDTLDDGDWESAFDLNLMSAIRLTRLCLPHMREKHWGRVITSTSSSVKQPLPTLMPSVPSAVRFPSASLGRSSSDKSSCGGACVSTARSSTQTLRGSPGLASLGSGAGVAGGGSHTGPM